MPVVDASVVVDWVAPVVDPTLPSLAVLRRLAETDEAILAPRLLFEEVGNALLMGIRRGRWTGPAADASWELLLRLPVRLIDDARDLERAWDLARRYDAHPIYDLLYAAVAERHRTRLITADERLRRLLHRFEWVISPEGFIAGPPG